MPTKKKKKKKKIQTETITFPYGVQSLLPPSPTAFINSPPILRKQRKQSIKHALFL
jgi:hypothetical protein